MTKGTKSSLVVAAGSVFTVAANRVTAQGAEVRDVLNVMRRNCVSAMDAQMEKQTLAGNVLGRRAPKSWRTSLPSCAP